MRILATLLFASSAIQGHLAWVIGHVHRLRIDAAVHALASAGIDVQVRSYKERSVRPSKEAGDAQAYAFLKLAPSAGGCERYGVGLDNNIVTASVKALLSGGNRLSLPVATLTAKLAA